MGRGALQWLRPFSRSNREKKEQLKDQQHSEPYLQHHSYDHPQPPIHYQPQADPPHQPYPSQHAYQQPQTPRSFRHPRRAHRTQAPSPYFPSAQPPSHPPPHPHHHQSSPPAADSSAVPFHSNSTSPARSPLAPTSLLAADITPTAPIRPPPVPSRSSQPVATRSSSSRRSRGDRSKRDPHNSQPPAFRSNSQRRTWRRSSSNRIAFARNSPQPHPTEPPFNSTPVAPETPVLYAHRSTSVDDGTNVPPSTLDFHNLPSQSFASDTADDSVASIPKSAPTAPGPTKLDNFVPHRPNHRRPAHPSAPPRRVPDFRVSSTTPPGANSLDSDRPPRSHDHSNRYHTTGGDSENRFVFLRRKKREKSSNDTDHYFGATQQEDSPRASDIRPGEEVLIKFLSRALGPKAQNIAVRLMNKTPITSSANFSYVIHQGTEESDVDIIRRDLTNGRLYTSGVRLLGGGWCNLLLGDRFSPGSAPRQRHELTYRRSSCTCVVCRVRTVEMARQYAETHSQSDYGSELDSTNISADVLSTMSSTSRTPTHSAMANFVVRYKLPSVATLLSIGASSSSKELEIGSVVRLNYRASAKLKFTEDVRELFGQLAYTGPISHEEVYRKVTTVGVHYYLYNKGKKERKVYIQGELLRLPVDIGVVKLGTQPMYMPELGATFCIHRKQIMSVYVGEIVLEGNSLGSFIKTGIQYYIGFGEERGVCPVYPNKTLGKARKLGINELLMHHHMVDDLEVKCL